MRAFILTIFMVLFLIGSAAHAEPPSESTALLQLVSARLKAALAGQPYVVSQSCSANDCSIIIEIK